MLSYKASKLAGLAGVLGAVMCGLVVTRGFADTASDAVRRANASAYEESIRCFVINGIATGDQRELGHADQAAIFEAKARQSFDVATKLGDALGYSGSRMNQDFGLAQVHDLPKLLRDKAYYKGAVATCKALGLM